MVASFFGGACPEGVYFLSNKMTSLFYVRSLQVAATCAFFCVYDAVVFCFASRFWFCFANPKESRKRESKKAFA